MSLRDEIDPQGAVERQTAETAVAISNELSDLNPNIEIDAKEFGEHVRNGGWRLGLLVARSVQNEYGSTSEEKPWESEGISRASWYRRNETSAENSAVVSQKISAKAFARQAGGSITDKTVTKYLNAWNQAASQGFVPASSELSPGQDFTFKSEFDIDKELESSE